MQKRFACRCKVFCVGVFFLASAFFVNAGTYGPFGYEVYGDHIEIVGCDPSVLVAHIPSEIDELPVTSIDAYAFTNCTSLTGVLFPDTISSIGTEAFHGCSSLIRAVYMGIIPSLGTYAFDDVHSYFSHYSRFGGSSGDGHPVQLFEVYQDGLVVGFGEILTYVGMGGTVPIPTVVSGAYINQIHEHAFQGCTTLAGVAIPETVNVGEGAFDGCTSLTRAVYPGSVPSIHPAAFTGVHPDFYHYTKGFTIGDGHPVFIFAVYLDGLVFSGSAILTYVGGGTVAIPPEIGGDPVVLIMEKAFEDCIQLAGVSIPEMVEVRDGAFAGCASLTRAVYPGNVPSIHPTAFTDVHSGFKHYSRNGSSPDSHPAESYNVFQGGLVVRGGDILTYVGAGGTLPIPEEVEDAYGSSLVQRIMESAFEGCIQLAGVVIPETVSIVGDGAFEGCLSLTRAVYLGYVANVHSNAFADVHHSFTHYTIGWYPGDGHMVEFFNTYLDGLAFFGNDIVTYVGSGGTVVIPSEYAPDPNNPHERYPVNHIRANAFQGCTQLAGVAIPETVYVWEWAFEGCTSLTRAVYPDAGVPIIGVGAFTNVHPGFKHYSRSGTSLGDGHPVESFEVYQDGLVVYAGEILTYVGGGTVSIPEEVVDAFGDAPILMIGEYAFQSCAQLAGVSIPETVYVMDGAFDGCTSLTRAVYPGNLPSMGSSVFTDVHPDFRHYMQSGSSPDSHPVELYDVYQDGLVFRSGDILTYVGGGTVAIPTEIGGNPVGRIMEDAFQGCTQLAGVSIPEMVEVRDGAFDGCTSLTRAVYPGDVVSPVLPNAFSDVHPSFKHYTKGFSIGDGHPVMHYQTYLDGLVVGFGEILTYVGAGGTLPIPSDYAPDYNDPWDRLPINSIRPYAFQGSTQLAGVAIPETVDVWEGAFEGCTSLTRAVYPDADTPTIGPAFVDVHPGFKHYSRSGTSLGDGHPVESFMVYKDGLVVRAGELLTYVGVGGTVAIPMEVEDAFGESDIIQIREKAFQNCITLAGVSIPETVYVESRAFNGCSSLTRAVYPGNMPPVQGDDAFSGVHPDFRRYTHYGSSPDWHPAEAFDVYQEGLVFRSGDILTYVGGGTVAIPTEIGGNPVGRIMEDAFQGCTQLAGVSIPEMVEVRDGAFDGCTSLTRAVYPGDVASPVLPNAFSDVHPSFKHYTKGWNPPGSHPVEYYETYLDGLVVSGGDILTYIGGGTVAIPAEIGGNSIALIMQDAFQGCSELVEVVISETVSYVGDGAFGNCSALTNAYFLGDAPGTFGSSVFYGASNPFSIYYWSGGAGFTSPTWQGYPAQIVNGLSHSVASWLVGHGFYLDADMTQDLSGDGVALLTAYALNLDPHEDLSSEFPLPVIDTDAMTLGMIYYAGADNIIYHVETSTNLHTWTSSDVMVSPPDFKNQSTASIDMNSPVGFMRLRFELVE